VLTDVSLVALNYREQKCRGTEGAVVPHGVTRLAHERRGEEHQLSTAPEKLGQAAAPLE
jgi:hypothetical protein